MENDIVTVGTKTSTGGKVLTGNAGFKVNGQDVAVIGDIASCNCGSKSCRKTGPIIQKSPRNIAFNGVMLAKQADLVDTGCGNCFILPSEHKVTLGTETAANIRMGNGVNFGNNIRINTHLPSNVGANTLTGFSSSSQNKSLAEKVFMKSKLQPYGEAKAGVTNEPIENFGEIAMYVNIPPSNHPKEQEESSLSFNPFDILFPKAHAAPIMPVALPAPGLAQSALLSSANSANGSPFCDDNCAHSHQFQSLIPVYPSQLSFFNLSLKDRWILTTKISAMFFMKQAIWYDDETQYTDEELIEKGSVQTRVRLVVEATAQGEGYYPTVRAYHDNSYQDKITVKLVEFDPESDVYSVNLSDTINGPTILWTPDHSDLVPRQLPSPKPENFDLHNIIVTPIHEEEAYVETYTAHDWDWKENILVFPDGSNIPPLYIMYHVSNRGKPGVVTGHGEDVKSSDGYWLGEDANSGLGVPIPTRIADKLRGREFNNFDEFRKAFWLEVSKDDELMSQFSRSNQRLLKSGKSPFTIDIYQVGGRQKFELHHLEEIQYGGKVYNINNIRINTPKNHIKIHQR